MSEQKKSKKTAKRKLSPKLREHLTKLWAKDNCGMTLKELKKKLKFDNIRINREGGYGLVGILSTAR